MQNHLQHQAPDQYSSSQYTSLEISPKLAHMQQQKVPAGSKHAAHYSILQLDATEWSAWHGLNERPCIILLMEVLDNLPHDR